MFRLGKQRRRFAGMRQSEQCHGSVGLDFQQPLHHPPSLLRVDRPLLIVHENQNPPETIGMDMAICEPGRDPAGQAGADQRILRE